jgi:glycosyltransferase involved in cell wall biosynthesis
MYSAGMGYIGNCLPAALARLGHDVHVVTSTFNQYANEPMYDETYSRFVGPRQVDAGSMDVDGYRLTRLNASLVGSYVRIKGLARHIRSIQPDLIYSCEVASLETFALVMGAVLGRYRLFCGTHQTFSVLKPFLLRPGSHARKARYWLTRTLPTAIASRAVERVYAQAPDCLEIAVRFYGVPAQRAVLRPLATNTQRFHPPATTEERDDRCGLRRSLGFADDDVVCLYSGRFADHKNPLLLARAIERANANGHRFRGLMIGDGPQLAEIAYRPATVVVPFMPHAELPRFYRAADIGVWPRQESMSMLDAAATGLPLIVSDTMSDPSRIAGNGITYREDSLDGLVGALQKLADVSVRRDLGKTGRRRMVEEFTWSQFAKQIEADFETL